MRQIHHKLPLSLDHLQAAVVFADQARAFEDSTLEPRMFHRKAEHFGVATGCVFACVAYLEATINEFSAEIAEEAERAPYGLGAEAIARFRGLWPTFDRASILDKYQAALTIADRATYEKPAQTSAGIRHVIVAGVPVIENGALDPNSRPGRPVRRTPAP